ncbi:MAG: carbohydrate ABC transporter permease [Lachnospiraceae bacterium]|nr:carbohydrate ABC transporter permease [Lachnospiraceae bacterium]
MIKKSWQDKLFDFCNTIFMILIMFITAYPLWHVLMGSFSSPRLLSAHTGLLLKPLGFYWDSYISVFTNPNILSGYLNTLFVVVVGTLSSTLITAIGAYCMSRKAYPFKRTIMFFFIFTMYFSGGIIPTYLLTNNYLHMGNNRAVLIIPVLITTYNMIILRSGFEAVPDSLEESARIDGANHIRILFQIIIPCAKAPMAVIVLYYAVSYWNEWFRASLYITDKSKLPLQVILREILNTVASGDAAEAIALTESVRYASIIVATLPVLCVYPFVQKYFVKGTMIGAVKG